MRRHVGVAAVDLRIVAAGLDHRDLGVVRHQQRRHATDRLEGADVAADPVGEPLRPGRLRVGEAAPSTATKICAARRSPVSRSITTGTPSPA
jgi:hypothetical protein